MPIGCFCITCPSLEGGWILVHLNHMDQSGKSSFLEEDLILLTAKWQWCWQAKYYIEKYLHFCLFVLNKRRLWDVTHILDVSKVYSDLCNSLDLAKLQLCVSHCGWNFMMCVIFHSLTMENHTRNVSNIKHTLLVLRLFPGKPKPHLHLESHQFPGWRWSILRQQVGVSLLVVWVLSWLGCFEALIITPLRGN